MGRLQKIINSKRSEKCHRIRGLASLFPHEMDRNNAGMRRFAMFPEINSLPGSERKLAATKWNGEVHRGQRRADVRRHVVIAFGGMDEMGIAIRDQTGEKVFQIPAHIRV